MVKIIFHFLVLFPLMISGQKKFSPDTIVNGVALMSGVSFKHKFSKYKLPDYFEADHPPKLEFINRDKTQKFTVFHCYGSGKNDICTFRIEYRGKTDSIPNYGVIINDSIFKSGREIILGISIEEFKKKIGTEKLKTKMKNNQIIIVLELDDFKKNQFLQSYNMPFYLAEYFFRNNKLFAFEFGFPTP